MRSGRLTLKRALLDASEFTCGNVLRAWPPHANQVSAQRTRPSSYPELSLGRSAHTQQSGASAALPRPGRLRRPARKAAAGAAAPARTALAVPAAWVTHRAACPRACSCRRPPRPSRPAPRLPHLVRPPPVQRQPFPAPHIPQPWPAGSPAQQWRKGRLFPATSCRVHPARPSAAPERPIAADGAPGRWAGSLPGVRGRAAARQPRPAALPPPALPPLPWAPSCLPPAPHWRGRTRLRRPLGRRRRPGRAAPRPWVPASPSRRVGRAASTGR